MTVRRAGNRQSQFVNRCTEEDRCVCFHAGDRNVYVTTDGETTGPWCMVIDREDSKLEYESVGVQSSTVEVCWLDADCIPLKKGSTIRSGRYEYKLKESPVNRYDGWYKAMLQLLCEHC